jgi:hypothetical protein
VVEVLLLKGLVLVDICPLSKMRIMEEEQTRSCGECVQPLENVKTKYLAVSPVTDIYEQLELETVG